ncbi:uncharacterized protein LOC143145462 [Ptiloglossa arizonensis]|uniref:uncharacterized protein LOC143145462 n=1 Tax=Ptiloglossa arizonensis TaxID=3350558 RepID=UPI003F9ECEA6
MWKKAWCCSCTFVNKFLYYIHGIEICSVKASAFLYEITARTNELAQPRVRVANIKSLRYSSASQIPEASPRIIELSKPRMIYQQPSKPVGYVSSNALTAIATQRIIELSKPKKKRKMKESKRMKFHVTRNSKKASKLSRERSW